ncbi:hypothetical protein GCM10020331_025620 [Ectobacillus funiculus]
MSYNREEERGIVRYDLHYKIYLRIYSSARGFRNLIGSFEYLAIPTGKKLAAKVLFIITLLLYISVIPLTGNILTQTLEQRHTPPSQVDGDVIVMLGGGATPDSPDIDGKGQLSGNGANRLLTTIRLYNQTRLPIILSGGQVFTNYGNEANIAKRQLISLGVPEEKNYP